MGFLLKNFYCHQLLVTLILISSTRNIAATINGVFNVMDFGAFADGNTDDSKAFASAWKETCNWEGQGRRKILAPQGTYLISSAVFQGPCRGSISFELNGLVKAQPGLLNLANKESWISFQRLNGFTLTGGGTFHGQGRTAWPHNNCPKNSNCKLPISLRFDFLNDSTIRGIKSIDSKFFHMNILGCYNLKLRSIKIFAPEDSPNTDGIHIGSSQNIEISRSVIATDDDCVSLGHGSRNVVVSNVQCGPRHGISVGSLGKYKDKNEITGLTVRNCTFIKTLNGVRIKTWSDSQVGIASNFTFEDIVMKNVANPIVIDQEYCPHKACNIKVPSKVKISNVKFKRIRGTSSSKVAVNLVCSKLFPCQNVEIGDITLAYSGQKVPTILSCYNVRAKFHGKQMPPTCV